MARDIADLPAGIPDPPAGVDAAAAAGLAALLAAADAELEQHFRVRTRELLAVFAVMTDRGLDTMGLLMQELAAAGVELPPWIGMIVD